MDINVKIRFESPEIMAALLAFVETISQMKLATNLQIKERQVAKETPMSHCSENRSAQAAIGEVKNSQVKKIALEDVRAKLAILNQKGKEVQVKALIRKFGGNKLTEVSTEYYEALLKEAEGL